MPFLEIIGVTSTWKNYNVAGVFLQREQEDNYVWAAQQLLKMCSKCQVTPTCLVTDREKALMNALDKLFPSAKSILCRRHVKKNIEDNARKEMKDKSLGTRFANAYYNLFKQTTVSEYERELRRIQSEWRVWPHLLQYVRNNWLIPYRERLVSAWTDTVFTLGTSTTNRLVVMSKSVLQCN